MTDTSGRTITESGTTYVKGFKHGTNKFNTRSINEDVTLSYDDCVVFGDSSTGNIYAYLPSAKWDQEYKLNGFTYYIKKSSYDTNKVIVSGTDTINTDGRQVSSYSLMTANPKVTLVSDGNIWHVITDWYLYQNDPVAALYIWNGGLGIYGGIIGGLLGAYIYCRKQKLPFLQILDLLVVFIPLAQIIGRLGNLVNQEIFGPKTSLPWGFYVERLGNYFHPAFLYEQLGNLILFIILYNTYKYLRSKSYPQDQLNHKLIQHKLTRLFVGKSGSLFILYLLGYAFIRFIVDFFRLEPAFYLGLTFAQFFSLLVMSGCLFPLILKEQKYRQS